MLVVEPPRRAFGILLRRVLWRVLYVISSIRSSNILRCCEIQGMAEDGCYKWRVKDRWAMCVEVHSQGI